MVELRKLIQGFDPQDATNYVLTFFTLKIISVTSGDLNYLPKWWGMVPWLSLFQILRKPDSWKNLIRPVRVGLAPVSVIVTWTAAFHQIFFSGIFSLK